MSQTDASPRSIPAHWAVKPVATEKSLPKAAAQRSYKNVLLSYLTDPQKHAASIFRRTADVTVVRDAFPKAKIHLLVLPNCRLDNLEVLNATHVPIVAKMIETADQICHELVQANPIVQLKSGFHAIPSLNQLHMHVISQEFESPGLKTKKHWNSFTTAFFIDARAVLKQLESQGRVVIDVEANELLLRSPLVCNQCPKRLRDIPSLKVHLRQRHRF